MTTLLRIKAKPSATHYSGPGGWHVRVLFSSFKLSVLSSGTILFWRLSKSFFSILRSYFTWSGCHATAVGDPAQPEQSWRSSSGSHPGAHQELSSRAHGWECPSGHPWGRGLRRRQPDVAGSNPCPARLRWCSSGGACTCRWKTRSVGSPSARYTPEMVQFLLFELNSTTLEVTTRVLVWE